MFSKLLGWMVLRARSDNSKEIEILYIRHQLAVLQRRTPRPQVGWTDRAVIAALARLLPVWRRHRMLVTPSTILRWHRQPAVTTASSATGRALMRYDGEVVRHAGARASSALHLRPLIDAAGPAIGFAATGRGPPTSCRTTKIAPAGHRRRAGLRKRGPTTRVWMSDRSCQNCVYDHGRRAYDHGGRAGYSPPLDRWRRSLCTSEWYTISATPKGGTA